MNSDWEEQQPQTSGAPSKTLHPHDSFHNVKTYSEKVQ